MAGFNSDYFQFNFELWAVPIAYMLLFRPPFNRLKIAWWWPWKRRRSGVESTFGHARGPHTVELLKKADAREAEKEEKHNRLVANARNVKVTEAGEAVARHSASRSPMWVESVEHGHVFQHIAYERIVVVDLLKEKQWHDKEGRWTRPQLTIGTALQIAANQVSAEDSDLEDE